MDSGVVIAEWLVPVADALNACGGGTFNLSELSEGGLARA